MHGGSITKFISELASKAAAMAVLRTSYTPTYDDVKIDPKLLPRIQTDRPKRGLR